MATSWLLFGQTAISLKAILKHVTAETRYPTKMSSNKLALGTESALYRIPTELLDHIAEYVGYTYSQLEIEEPHARATCGSMGDLRSLSLVTRHFRASAQRS